MDKLQQEIVLDFYQDPRSQPLIAEKFNITVSTVSRAITIFFALTKEERRGFLTDAGVNQQIR